ncbi:MAG: exodeoxyribonuclease VII small subunit [Halioglobus sp.]
MPAKKDKALTDTAPYEAILGRLESIVTSIETEAGSLQDAMAAFEEGVTLTREAQEALHSAEQKVALLLNNGDEVTTGTLPSSED